MKLRVIVEKKNAEIEIVCKACGEVSRTPADIPPAFQMVYMMLPKTSAIIDVPNVRAICADCWEYIRDDLGVREHGNGNG